jgi:hypothetical protein
MNLVVVGVEAQAQRRVGLLGGAPRLCECLGDARRPAA